VILCDVNVLVYAFRRDSPDHEAYAEWLTGQVNDDAAFGVSSLVLSGFLRIVINRRIFHEPSTLEKAGLFCQQLQDAPNSVTVEPTDAHWRIFLRLCRQAKARGNLIPDAYFAALAIEHGCEWITTDRDFARFPGLQWRSPLAS
jgi:hypothetical protein